MILAIYKQNDDNSYIFNNQFIFFVFVNENFVINRVFFKKNKPFLCRI